MSPKNPSKKPLKAATWLGMAVAAFLSSASVLAASEISGELDVIIKEDFERNVFETDYFIRDDNGIDWHQLEFERTPPGHLRSGQRLRVKGQAKGRKFHVDSMEDDSAAKPRGPQNEIVEEGEMAMMQAVEERNAVVIMVDLTNAKTSSYTSPTQVAGHMYTNSRSVDGLYREASLGQFGFNADADGDGKPDVFGPFAIDYDNSTCSYYTWATAGEAAAQAAGVDLSRYRHRVFVLPRSSELPSCSWAGIANVGCGTFCRAWIAGNSGPLFAHELGHNLNMAHAGTDPENDGVINNAYGDVSDPMGSSGTNWRLFNAGHIDQMGWYGNVPGSIKTVLSSGAHEIAAIGTEPWSSDMPLVLKISKPDSKDFYYLSYRQAIGDYGQLSTTFTRGINIHRYRGSGYAATTHLQTLSDGGVFNDDVNGITVQQIARNGNTATVQVSFGCAPTAPQVSVAPAALALRPGQSANFSVSVTNQDSGGCGTGSYVLDYDGDLPGSVTPAQQSLNGGQTGNANLQADAGGAMEGSYPVDVIVTALNADDPNLAHTTGSATVIVDGTPPSVPAGLTASVDKQGRVNLSWQASSDALSDVTGYTVYRDGAAIANVNNTGFTDSNTTSGAVYSYSVSARDAAGNVSALSSPLTVTAGSAKGGGGGGNNGGGKK